MKKGYCGNNSPVKKVTEKTITNSNTQNYET